MHNRPGIHYPDTGKTTDNLTVYIWKFWFIIIVQPELAHWSKQ